MIVKFTAFMLGLTAYLLLASAFGLGDIAATL